MAMMNGGGIKGGGMSAPDHTAPTAASSGFSIWTLLRIAGIIVGVAALLRLAVIGFGIEYKEFFQAFLNSIANIVELGFLLEPLEKFVHAALGWLRGFDLSIPDLQPHWRPVFTLTWLFMGSFARNYAADAIALLMLFVLASICAFAAAILSGMATPASTAIPLWPIVAFLLFRGIVFAVERSWMMAIVFLIVAAFIAFGILVWSTNIRVEGRDANLLALATIIGIFGLAGLLRGLLRGKSWRERYDDPATATGLDILGVMGLALGIGYLMMK